MDEAELINTVEEPTEEEEEEEEEEENESVASDENFNYNENEHDNDSEIIPIINDDDDEEYEEEKSEINKEELGELTTSKSEAYKSSYMFDDDLEASDSQDFLQKFDKESKSDFIATNHQECFSKNLDEIKDLLNVIRDKNNIIIDELHKTLPMLTKYEKTRILGIRLKQLNNGSLPYIKVAEDILDNLIIAEKELKQKKIPFIIQRPLPNNTFEYWKLEDLEIL
tara:strand:+ start:12060 stop:12734 length:675 start_codon:yes stop_codon:yes gene_type:complete